VNLTITVAVAKSNDRSHRFFVATAGKVKFDLKWSEAVWAECDPGDDKYAPTDTAD
jgi:hypothetical protein